VFLHAFDLVEATAVFVFTGPANTDRDYERYLEVIRMLDARVAGRDAALVQIVDSGSPIPNASWRRRIAEQTKTFRCRPTFALVSDSALVRGAQVAINWIRPPPFPMSVVATFEQAVSWSEARRGRPIPVLASLLRAARVGGAAGCDVA
jgi:hypothetical protein